MNVHSVTLKWLFHKGFPTFPRREFLWIPLKKQGRVQSELIWLACFIWFLIFFQFKPECQSFVLKYLSSWLVDGKLSIKSWDRTRLLYCTVLLYLPICLINAK
jgi:hypothetical protein